MTHLEQAHPEALPAGVVVRIDVTEGGVKVQLQHSMTDEVFAHMLRDIADAYEQGTVGRIKLPAQRRG